MNRLFFSFLLVFVSANAKSFSAVFDENTEYRPFVEEGKQWTVIQADYRVYSVKTYYVAGDTIIGNYVCKRLMCKTTDYSRKTSTTELHSCLYEENGKVCYFPKSAQNTSAPIVLYNFGAIPGDTLYLGGQREDESGIICYQIWKELTLENGNEAFRGQLATIYDSNLKDVDENSNLDLFEWYEVIGSVFHPFEKTFFNNYMGGPKYWLYQCKVGEKLLYSNTKGIEIDDVSNIAITENRPSDVNTFYNINGQKILQPVSKGVYIKNNQKYICK